MGPSQISDTPFQGYGIAPISPLAVPKLDVDFCELCIYIYINVAVSCKRYPPSLAIIIIVQSRVFQSRVFQTPFSSICILDKAMYWQVLCHINRSYWVYIHPWMICGSSSATILGHKNLKNP